MLPWLATTHSFIHTLTPCLCCALLPWLPLPVQV